MNLKLSAICCGAILCQLSFIYAAPLSPQQALERFRLEEKNRISTVSSPNLKSLFSSTANPSLVYSISNDSKPTIYLFNFTEGGICLSADDNGPALLGYADSNFDKDNLPPAFLSWLNMMSEEIDAVRSGDTDFQPCSTRGRSDFSSIAPLCQTKWNQDAPYFYDCPMQPGTNTRCYTGCAATSLAQIMKFHQWPDRGEGEITYKWRQANTELSMNFAQQPFDWQNMLNEYTPGNYNAAEAAAVAYLMKSAGYAIEMDYSNAGSSAVAPYMGRALGEYFKYDKSKLRYAPRDYFTLDEWEEMIYNSLKNDGPVVVNGQSNQGGHSFVCDGYDSDGYFHINWGWGGISDGYFLLNMLDPYNQGIGGSGDNSGFNFNQDAILGITPAKNGSEAADAWIGQLYAKGYLGIDAGKEYALGEEVNSLCVDGVFNYGPGELPEDTLLGLLFRSNSTGECYGSVATIGQPVQVFYGFLDFTLPLPTEIPDGLYRLTFSYYSPSFAEKSGKRRGAPRPDTPNETPREDKNESADALPSEGWLDVYFPNGVPSAYNALVSNGHIVFEESSWRPTGIDEAEIATCLDETPRYFNLQGIELKSPSPGEIVIIRRGSRISKEIYK